MRDADMNDLAEIFPGTSEMARILRDYDWDATALGDPRKWPDALRIPLRMLLTTRFEMWLGWGPDLHFFYNDAYIPTLGIKHPAMLAHPLRQVWSEVYDKVADQVDRVRQGEATWNNALLLLLERSGFPEETYHSFSYSPLYQADGTVGGLLCVVSEETARVIGERRLDTMRQLGMALTGVTTRDEVVEAVHVAFDTNRRDFPFIALHLSDGDATSADTRMFERAAGHLQDTIDRPGAIVALPEGGDWPRGDWDRSPHQAIVISIPGVSGATTGKLLLALNPYRGDDHFSRFYTEEDRASGEPLRALETAREKGRFLAEGWRVRKNGERFRASVVIDAIRNDQGRPIGFAKITRDVTERDNAQRELEIAREALFQSQKMDAIGQLTGGIAHDFQ